MGSVSKHLVIVIQSFVSLAFALVAAVTPEWTIRIKGNPPVKTTSGLPWLALATNGTPMEIAICCLAIVSPILLLLLLVLNVVNMGLRTPTKDDKSRYPTMLLFAGSLMGFIAVMGLMCLLMIQYFNLDSLGSYSDAATTESISGNLFDRFLTNKTTPVTTTNEVTPEPEKIINLMGFSFWLAAIAMVTSFQMTLLFTVTLLAE